MSDISKLIAELTPEQLELLRRSMGQTADSAKEEKRPPLVARTGSEDTFPLSFAQQRFWFLHQLAPETSAFNIPFAVRLKGALDAGALERAFAEIVRRHKVLNTSFRSADGQPVQVIHADVPSPLVVRRDLAALDADAREAEALCLVREALREPFDLTRHPLLRVRLLRLGAAEHVLALAVDHIATDAWSAGVLLHELVVLYQAFSAGRPSPLEELPVQYADFAVWQREWLQGEALESQLAYWRRQLDGVPAELDLPTDLPRRSGQQFRTANHSFRLGRERLAAVHELSRREDATLFMTLFAAFCALLHRYTGRDDILVGTPVSNRSRPELQGLLGCFVNHVVMRGRVAPGMTFRELLAQARVTTLDAHAHQDLPFEKLVEELQPGRAPGQAPFLRVVFNLYESRPPELTLPGLEVEPFEFKLGTTSDLDLMLVGAEHDLNGSLRYNAALFDAETVERLADAFVTFVERCARTPDTRLADLALDEALAARAAAARTRERKMTIAVAATFTAEPLEESLAFWAEELDTPARVEFAPYNQVFQQLLGGGELLSRNEEGVNVVLVRFEDWEGRAGEDGEEGEDGADEAAAHVERNARDFVHALKAAASRTPAPFLVAVCPASPEAAADAARGAAFSRAEEELRAGLAGASGVSLLTPDELSEIYPVASYFDAQRNALGHVPYRPEFFAALGTMLARRIHALQRPPAKVLVLDCDQTLWRGVLGEEGVMGVEVDAPRRALQEFVVRQHEAGMLVCLCSKNNEEDVAELFRRRPEMPLRREHVVAWRVNWKPKSENIKSLAEELGLGLESFIFLDDDPVECAEVEANCPQVLTLCLPRQAETIPRFLKHVWAFDRLGVTAEDRNRTALYRQNAERERFRHTAPTFRDFISGLELKVEISPIEPPDFARAAQLTGRTNQFNTTTVRRSEADLRRLCASGEMRSYAVRVRDRFGDYGLVGLLVARLGADSVVLDSFLLSCRVLGRGVEHQMLLRAAELAQEVGLARVDVPFIPTEKNRPALNFLEAVGSPFKERTDEGFVFKLPVEVAAALSFGVEDEAAPTAPEVKSVGRRLSAAAHAPASRAGSARARRVAEELFDPQQVVEEIAERRRRLSDAEARPYVAPRTPVEEKLADIFRRVLGVERVGLHDNFFKLGGHSLLGTLLMSRVRDAFEVELSLLTLFDSPTVEALAEAVRLGQVEQLGVEEIDRMMEELDGLTDEEVRALLAEEED
ncbi:MAG TPA: HAD-IIIC family phosphatase [Pyrinomonadaceae bacterium]|nr:HAD-IIIC family phosphatase [Pyrinomonadaceae bacterium]